MLIDPPTRDIADILHNEPKTLQNRSPVAESRIPRTRLHLFAEIRFFSVERLEARKTFLNPSNSPPHTHTHSLTLSCPQAVMVVDAKEGGRIRSFSRVVYSNIDSPQNPNDSETVSLASFHWSSPALKSLSMPSTLFQNSQIFDLVLSLPLLENLMLIDNDSDIDGPPTPIDQPSTSPAFTDTPEPTLTRQIGAIARQLLSLPNGFWFPKLVLPRLQDDLQRINALVAWGSGTLESFRATFDLHGGIFVLQCWDQLLTLLMFTGNQGPASVDLSKTTRLNDADFWSVALRTVTESHRDFQQISMYIPSTLPVPTSGKPSEKLLMSGGWT